jgi:hypothetical protein
MKTPKSIIGSVATVALAAFLASATARADGRIHKRKERQQDRIAQGVQGGQLTAGETARLERKEARLNHEIRDMREDNGGKLTAQERRKVNRQQNRLSRQIYRQKHDRQTQ